MYKYTINAVKICLFKCIRINSYTLHSGER